MTLPSSRRVPTFPKDLPDEQWMAPDEQFLRRLEYLGDSAYTRMKTVSQQISHVSRKWKSEKKLTTAE